jgi:uncharacterized protein YjiS (DUF1127 family)
MQFVQARLVALLQNYKALLRRIVEWRQCAAGRRELRTLTDRDLRDIGIGRSEAEAEANKPFWEMPRAEQYEALARKSDSEIAALGLSREELSRFIGLG